MITIINPLPDYNPSSFDKFSHFDTREVGRRYYEMLDDFVYVDMVFGPICAPKGFRTDYASLDYLRNLFLFPLYALLAGYGDKAATVHDLLYGGYVIVDAAGIRRNLTRKEADEVFYRALRDEGIATWRAALFYAGVRAGGKRRFRG